MYENASFPPRRTLLSLGIEINTSGGNQRDMDRAKAQKKLAQMNKSKKTDGVSHNKRAEK